ncbi:MAG TPA: TonB-dependent receptor [Puia sp.]|nr:TonB-dependent receptor [Puia sp.]
MTSVHAQLHAVTGRVTASDGPAEGATVMVAGSRLGARTGQDGGYRIDGVPGSACTLEVSLVGFQSQRIRVLLSAPMTQVDVVMERASSQLNEVIVTGVSRATAIRESPLAMEAVSGKQIEQTAAPNVIDAIAVHAPGFAAVKTGPNVSKPFINGMGYNRVLTLYDGLRVETQQWGDEHGVPMDDYVIERAEVIKGPASLMYGSDAIAGVLSLFPIVPHTQDGKLHARWLSEYQANNGLVGNNLMLWRGAEHWSWALRGSERIARNYTDPVDGRVYNTGFKTGNASAFVGYKNANGYSHLNATWYDSHQGIPDGSRDSLTRRFTYQVYEAPGERARQAMYDDITNRPIVSQKTLNSYKLSPLSQRIQDYRLYSDNSYSLGAGDIKASLGYEENRRREFNHPTATEQPGEFIILRTLDYALRYNAPGVGNIEPSVGVNGMYQTNNNDHTATDFPIPNYHLFDIGAYAFGKWTQGKWTIAGGIRYDHRTERGAGMYADTDRLTGYAHQVPTAADTTGGGTMPFSGFTLHFQGWTGSVGATYQLSAHLSVKANVARGYRAPNITEIASNGLDPGAHIFYLGNLHFSPEFSLQEDVGIHGDFDDWSFGTNVFNNFIRHYIYEDQAVNPLGNPLVIVPGNKTFQFQQTNAQLYGGDAELRLHPRQWNGFYADAVFTCVYGFNRSSHYKEMGNQGEYLPFIPPPRLLGGVGYDHALASTTFRSLAFRVDMDRCWAQNRYLGLFGTETPTPAYTLFNVSAHTDLRYDKNRTMQVQLQVNNLFNTAYQSHLSRLQYFEYYTASPNGHLGIFEMGRNVCVKMIFNLF